MRIGRRPTCLDEPVGADGREIGKQRELQVRLDELSASAHIAATRAHATPRVAVRDASRELWARAEEICARNGLAIKTSPDESREAGPRSLGRSAIGQNADASPTSEPLDVTLPRSCPQCGHGMNRTATLCGYCWIRVAPMGSDGIEPEALPTTRPWWRFWGG
jgi:hypothetical protein